MTNDYCCLLQYSASTRTLTLTIPLTQYLRLCCVNPADGPLDDMAYNERIGETIAFNPNPNPNPSPAPNPGPKPEP